MASISKSRISAVFSGFLKRSLIRLIAATALPVSKAIVSAIKASANSLQCSICKANPRGSLSDFRSRLPQPAFSERLLTCASLLRKTVTGGEKLIKINDHGFRECSPHACSRARSSHGCVGDVLIGQDLLDILLRFVKNSCRPAEAGRIPLPPVSTASFALMHLLVCTRRRRQ